MPSPWTRWRLPAAAIACVVLALAFWLWPTEPKPSSGVVPPESSTAVTGRVRAEIAVEQFKDLGEGKKVKSIGTISEKLLDGDQHPRLNDLVRVHPPFEAIPGSN